mgnify:CR=1 FL=1
MENKPFIFGIATSGDNFTDRKKETERLLLNFQHGVNTVLISPRRWGKTSLVQKVCRLAQSDKLKIVYLDIFSCRSDKEFYNAFATAIIKQTSSKFEEWLDNAKLFLSRITPKISIGPDPMTDFSISLEMNPKSEDIDEILQLPEKIALSMFKLSSGTITFVGFFFGMQNCIGILCFSAPWKSDIFNISEYPNIQFGLSLV